LLHLFIIAGCNGAGKTTASFTVLPELLQIKEFVNADEIARGLSPFQPERAAIEAGKIMLRRVQDLLSKNQTFAFETTLASRSFVLLIDQARQIGYSVNLIYYWLDTVQLAIERVKIRVSEGGHDIPTETIIRRYYAGIRNFVNLYKEKVDYWMLIDNSHIHPELIADGHPDNEHVENDTKWQTILKLAEDEARRY
jgi:predicted ABC-type ATPase